MLFYLKLSKDFLNSQLLHPNKLGPKKTCDRFVVSLCIMIPGSCLAKPLLLTRLQAMMSFMTDLWVSFSFPILLARRLLDRLEITCIISKISQTTHLLFCIQELKDPCDLKQYFDFLFEQVWMF